MIIINGTKYSKKVLPYMIGLEDAIEETWEDKVSRKGKAFLK